MGIRQTDMLPLQHTIHFSDYSELYDLIIPQDNLLRRIKDLVDFSFIKRNSWTNTVMITAVWLRVP